MELSEENVVFTKRSDAEDEAVRVRGQINPVYDKEGSLIGYKVSGRVELTISENLRGAAQVSRTPEGPTDVSVGAMLGTDPSLEVIKGRRGGRDPRHYERIAASLGPGSLSYKQERGEDSTRRKLGAQYDFPIGDADVSVHGSAGEVQRLFQQLMDKQNTYNLGVSAQGPIPILGGVGSLYANRRWGDDEETSLRGQYTKKLGHGEATLYGDIQDGDWQIGAGYKVPF